MCKLYFKKGVSKENILVLTELAVRFVPTQLIHLICHTFCVCQCSCLLKFICSSKISTGRSCSRLWTHTQQWKIWVTPWARSQLKSNKTMLCLLVSAFLVVSKCPFCGLFRAPPFSFSFLHVCVSSCWFCCFKMILTPGAEALLFVSMRRLCYASPRTYVC